MGAGDLNSRLYAASSLITEPSSEAQGCYVYSNRRGSQKGIMAGV